MRLSLPILLLFALCVPTALALEPCRQVHGRARLYTADGQLRIWQIGSHHEFEPADKASWGKLQNIMLPHGVSGTQYDLYADFTLCPTKPFKGGSVQPAIVKGIQHKRLVSWPK